ncbi:MAG: hypothetical protein KatS3mg090_0677 [Patescibacteria group bacterium]|nr:MAG: hypothetical protein KatS3mg090_0677 [Patescibacteria group bacterium]
MSKLEQIKEDKKFLEDIKSLAENYEMIAVMKIKKIKDQIISRRSFLKLLEDFYIDIKKSYQKQIEKLLNKKYFKDNKKKTAILISSDEKLYGGLAQKVFKKFLDNKHLYKNVILIGKSIKNILNQNLETQLKIKTISLKEFHEKTNYFIQQLTYYEKIDVYFPKFESIIKQEPALFNITGEPIQTSKIIESEKIEFLVEPDINKLFNFFKKEASKILLQNLISESELGLTAARIKTMEQAMQNIDTTLKKSTTRSHASNKIIKR